MNRWLLSFVAIVLGVLRVAGIKHEAFQAIAHLFVGGLFASGYTEYSFTWTGIDSDKGRNAMFKIWLGVSLSILELVCAIVFLINK